MTSKTVSAHLNYLQSYSSKIARMSANWKGIRDCDVPLAAFCPWWPDGGDRALSTLWRHSPAAASGKPTWLNEAATRELETTVTRT
jgi:hypothetical protein